MSRAWLIASVDPTAALGLQGRGLLQAFGSVVAEAVAALFFVQSDKAESALSGSFNRLCDNEAAQKAAALAAEISDPISPGSSPRTHCLGARGGLSSALPAGVVGALGAALWAADHWTGPARLDRWAKSVEDRVMREWRPAMGR